MKKLALVILILIAFCYRGPFNPRLRRTDLLGIWIGTAKKMVCGKEQGAVEVQFELKTPGTPSVTSGVAILTIGGDDPATVPVRLGPDTVKPALGVHSLYESTRKKTSSSSYWIDLTAKDRWGYVGNYQTLIGRLTQSNSGCPSLGDEGEVLTVTLKKR